MQDNNPADQLKISAIPQTYLTASTKNEKRNKQGQYYQINVARYASGPYFQHFITANNSFGEYGYFPDYFFGDAYLNGKLVQSNLILYWLQPFVSQSEITGNWFKGTINEDGSAVIIGPWVNRFWAQLVDGKTKNLTPDNNLADAEYTAEYTFNEMRRIVDSPYFEKINNGRTGQIDFYSGISESYVNARDPFPSLDLLIVKLNILPDKIIVEIVEDLNQAGQFSYTFQMSGYKMALVLNDS
jgi:hypothetical protein